MSRKTLIKCSKPHLFPFNNLLNNSLPDRNIAIRCMEPMQIILFSFSSPKAADAVREAGITVELMDLCLFGLNSIYNCGDQRIDLKFSETQKITWGFTGEGELDSEDINLHDIATIDGEVIQKSYQKSNEEAGSVTSPNQIVKYLTLIENHFRSIFQIKNTDIHIFGDEITTYEDYLDVGNPKKVRMLKINKELTRDHGNRILRAVQAEHLYFHARLPLFSDLSLSFKKITIESRYTTPQIDYNQWKVLDAEEIELKVFWHDTDFVAEMIRNWLAKDPEVKWVEKLKMLKIRMDRKVNRDVLFKDLNTMPYDGNRRAGIWKKVVNGEVELELELRHAVDIERSDGKLASIHVPNDYFIYFVVWHDRFPEY